MMADTIEDLTRKLTLTDAEEEELKLEEHMRINSMKGNLCLIGYLLTREAFNVEAMKATITEAWKLS